MAGARCRARCGAGARALYGLPPGREGTVKPGMYLSYLPYTLMFALLIAGLLGLARQPHAPADYSAVIDSAAVILGTGLLV